MNITELSLVNFRNYKRQSIELSPFVNIIMGKNAQGKTNLLESLYLCGVGRSPRTARDKEMIMFGCDRAQVKVVAQKSYGKDKVQITLDKTAKKAISINNLPITRMGELMGTINIVYFSPDEMRIVKEAPSDRRRFMDIALSQISRNYFYILSRYNRVVSQRNRLLKSGSANADNLAPWDEQLCETASLIIKTRKGFIKRLDVAAQKEHGFLTDNKEQLFIKYESVMGTDKEEIKQNLLRKTLESQERDLRLGVTNIGPHKDDFAVFIGGTDARKYGSQGQQRTAALSIKLAEVSLSTKEKGESPVLLLDDVMGELDQCRQLMMIKRISGLQAIITCTHLSEQLKDSLEQHKVIQIKNGVAYS